MVGLPVSNLFCDFQSAKLNSDDLKLVTVHSSLFYYASLPSNVGILGR